MPPRLASSSMTPFIHARPMRSISWRRNARTELAKSRISLRLRSSVARHCVSRLSRVRGASRWLSPSQVTDSTDLFNASPRNRELDST